MKSLVGVYKSLFPIRITGYIGELLNDEVRKFSASLPAGTKLLDAGAGHLDWKRYFPQCDYKSLDICYPENKLEEKRLDYIADLENMPEVPSNYFDAIIFISVLEHVKHPDKAIKEIWRILKPGGRLFLQTSRATADHQIPNNFFNFTPYGLRLLLEEAGFTPGDIRNTGGYFSFIGDKLTNFWFFFGDGYLMKIMDLITYPLLFLIKLVMIYLDKFDKEKTLSANIIAEAIK
jgi:SAM-dependent methyltransferase